MSTATEPAAQSDDFVAGAGFGVLEDSEDEDFEEESAEDEELVSDELDAADSFVVAPFSPLNALLLAARLSLR
ncbi:hypothetical protein [Nocardioides sp.]|uniref:hypothetical protein n=1 Tax=Nocardioides sp. TaxID=35761 RepID=UPI003D0A8A20